MLAKEGREEEYLDLRATPADSPEDVAENLSDAILQAEMFYEDYLVIPKSALKNIEKLDTPPAAGPWGNALWRGLSSLAGYARDKREGKFDAGFFQWCKHGGDAVFDPNNVAMKESTKLNDNPRLVEIRVFNCSKKLDRSGRLFIPAHLKIGGGRGQILPRVHFHDDVDGATGKVHIGYIGPHLALTSRT